MLLAMDIGNTNIKTGIYKDGRLLNSWRMTTDLHRTSDELGVQMESFFGHLGLSTRDVCGASSSPRLCRRSTTPLSTCASFISSDNSR